MYASEAYCLEMLTALFDPKTWGSSVNLCSITKLKYCEIGTLLRAFNLLILHCYRRYAVMSDISKDVNGAN